MMKGGSPAGNSSLLYPEVVVTRGVWYLGCVTGSGAAALLGAADGGVFKLVPVPVSCSMR